MGGGKKHYLGLEKICNLADREEKEGCGGLSFLKDIAEAAASVTSKPQYDGKL